MTLIEEEGERGGGGVGGRKELRQVTGGRRHSAAPSLLPPRQRCRAASRSRLQSPGWRGCEPPPRTAGQTQDGP